MDLIQSRQNKTIQEIISLRDKKNRREQQCFLVEGLRFVQEALDCGAKVKKICVSSDAVGKFQELESLNPEVQWFKVLPELFQKLTETESPQGILATVHIPVCSLASVYRKGFRGLLLDSVQDPGNVGTMIRSAHALGFDAVVATKGTADIFNSKVLRSTMGSVFHIPVVDNLSAKELFTFCTDYQLRLIASRVENAKPCHEADLSGDFFLVVGNEGKGISEEIQVYAAESVHIPMPGGAESLNAAVAASIIMYESNRQRG